jgi:hypothetical protein
VSGLSSPGSPGTGPVGSIGPIPTEYARERFNPTEGSSVGATQSDQVPMGRMGTIEELPNLEMFLLSDACPYLTGETIAMDSGQRLAGPGTFAGLTALSDDEWARDPRAKHGRVRGEQDAARHVATAGAIGTGQLPSQGAGAGRFGP